MQLALREMRRAKTRFGLLIAAVALLVFLILAQQAIQTGLITSFVGALREQSAPVIVYSTDGQRALQGSIVPPPLEAQIRGVEGAAAAGRIGQGTFTVRVEGDDDLSDAAIIGAEDRSVGGIEEVDEGRPVERPGEAVGSTGDFEIGDRVQVVAVGVAGAGEGPVLEVVGLVRGAQIQVTPTLFTTWDDHVAATQTVNPEAPTVLPNAIGLRPEDGITAAELAARVNDLTEEADALTRDEAAREAPGVAQVQQSFQIIFLLFALVVPLVTGLFFLIITFQKSASLTLLRAIGIRGGALVRSLLVQVVVVIGGGLVLGTLLYLPLTRVEVGSLVLRFDGAAVGVWSALLLVLGLLSALVAARRVLKIDPYEATVGGGAR